MKLDTRISRSLGSLSLLLLFAGPSPAQNELYEFEGSAANERLGHAVSGAADLDQDGFADFMAGAPAGSTAGKAKIFSGRDGGLMIQFEGSAQEGSFGWAVACAGDVDNDGTPDIAIAAPDSSVLYTQAGSVLIYSGSDGSLLHRFDGDYQGHRFGQALAGSGDANLDGHSDILIGSPQGGGGVPRGHVDLYSGRTGFSLLRLFGTFRSALLGTSVDWVGDLNGDGRDDFIAGAPHENANGFRAGQAVAYSGDNGEILGRWQGTAEVDRLGMAVSRAGDVDGDGVPDLLLGAPQKHNGTDEGGYVRLVSGRNGELLRELRAAAPASMFGAAIDGGQDVNADGVPDFVVGARLSDAGGEDSGEVLAFSGLDGALLRLLVGEIEGGQLGRAVSLLGDVNGDGHADFATGETGSAGGPEASGRIAVHSGHCGIVETYGSGCAGSGGIVPRLSVSGCVARGGSFSIDLEDGLGGAPALLLIGTLQSGDSLGGGCSLLVRLPLLAIHPLALDGSGTASLAAGLSMETPRQDQLMLQAVVLDGGGAKRFAMSNAVALFIE